MKHYSEYEELLNSIGYKVINADTPFVYESENTLIYITEKEDGYHVIDMCPKDCFDRWGNSRHISFRIMVENRTEENKHGWTQESVNDKLIKDIKDAELLCDIIPNRFFDHFISINL